LVLASHAEQEGLVMVKAELGGTGEREDPLCGLTEQERKLLELLSEGLTNRQIAARMFLAEKTVKNYVSRLLAKLGMERRTQAAVFGSRLAQRSGQPTMPTTTRTTMPPDRPAART
jgi:two-component system response regulator DevR